LLQGKNTAFYVSITSMKNPYLSYNRVMFLNRDARVILATVGDPVNDVRPTWFRRHERRVGQRCVMLFGGCNHCFCCWNL